MIKKIFAIAALLMLAGLSIAADECSTNFYLDVPIHITDQNHMDAQGVSVAITYQKRSSHYSQGPEYATTDPETTNISGMAQFKLLNTVPNKQYLDCKLKVNVSLMNYSKVASVDLKNFFNGYAINISAKKVMLNLKDGSGLPISARLVLYPDNEYDVNGSIYILLPYGPTPGFILFNGHRQSTVLNVNSTTPDSLDVIFKTYELNVTVMDDRGSGIPFSVQAGNGAPVSGTFTTAIKLVDVPSTIKVSAAGKELYRQVSPDAEHNATFYFDLHAPSLSNVKISPQKDGKLEISYSVADNGSRASGLSDTGIFINDVYYQAAVSLGTAKAYISQKGNFVFNITAIDNEGNRAVVSGEYVEGGVPISNITGNESGGNAVSTGGGDNTLLVIVGIVVVIILAFLFMRGGGESPDPSV
jgi:hypothetical protein